MMPPRSSSGRLTLSAAGFIATRTFGWPPGVRISREAKWIWKAETPARVPAGALISAGKSGSVTRSFPIRAVTAANRFPASWMPSPESPANRTTTRSFSSRTLLTTETASVDCRHAGGRAAPDNPAMDVRRLRVRAARAPDLDRVLELWAAARSPHARTADTPEVLARLVGRDPEALLVAELDGRIVGTLIAAFDGWRGNMYRLAVEAGLRRGGIGASLVSEGGGGLRQAGGRRVTALVGGGGGPPRPLCGGPGHSPHPPLPPPAKKR